MSVTGYVYAIAWRREGPTKIGMTNSVPHRLIQLQTGNPYRLRCFWAARCIYAEELEAAALAEFGALIMVGEWVNASPALAEATMIRIAEIAGWKLRRWMPSTVEQARDGIDRLRQAARKRAAVGEFRYLRGS